MADGARRANFNTDTRLGEDAESGAHTMSTKDYQGRGTSLVVERRDDDPDYPRGWVVES